MEGPLRLTFQSGRSGEGCCIKGDLGDSGFRRYIVASVLQEFSIRWSESNVAS